MVFCRLLASGEQFWMAPDFGASAHVAQLVERVLGKDEVISSILIVGSRNHRNATAFYELSKKDNNPRRAQWQKSNSNEPNRMSTSAPSDTLTTVSPP